MPYNAGTGVYSASSGAETATAGGTIQSAVWDQINVDYRTALTTLGHGVLPVLTSGVTASHYYTAPQVVNFAASASDIATFAITLPVSTSQWRPDSLRIGNAAASLSGVSVSLFTGANATGAIVISSTATTVTTNAINTPGNVQIIVAASANTTSFTAGQVFLHITASNAGSSTATVVFGYNTQF